MKAIDGGSYFYPGWHKRKMKGEAKRECALYYTSMYRHDRDLFSHFYMMAGKALGIRNRRKSKAYTCSILLLSCVVALITGTADGYARLQGSRSIGLPRCLG
ncbi:hypothetical protein ASPBRDRAFT_630371 [Aspergillus brasiliensis CBS 101740]|uniref:Uncharacterized protein n=1 Tax=Aspergillus brasiliensis (strain CBS 101740 / IMI 381727 / IBT 21946) TaxID=767769 RepID=A0A1L9UG74_ASPBC|nr:hypothetical protein ASPBRDRAFT_630371 [Aspergillus brasiliensis CBS 101740]